VHVCRQAQAADQYIYDVSQTSRNTVNFQPYTMSHNSSPLNAALVARTLATFKVAVYKLYILAYSCDASRPRYGRLPGDIRGDHSALACIVRLYVHCLCLLMPGKGRNCSGVTQAHHSLWRHNEWHQFSPANSFYIHRPLTQVRGKCEVGCYKYQDSRISFDGSWAKTVPNQWLDW
jgi:hypothetical protein